MKNKILFLMFGILLINFISATKIYSGETEKIEIGQEYDSYSIIGNSTIVNLNIYQDNGYIYITPDKYSLNDNFSIVFYEERESKKGTYTSGGGSKFTKKNDIIKVVDISNEEIEQEEINKETNKTEEKTKEEIEEKVKNKSIPIWVYIIGVVILSVAGYYVYVLVKFNINERRFS